MPKVKIEFDANKCVGYGICAEISPETFEMKGSKANLIGAENKDFLDVELDSEKQEKLVEAAAACPVNAIDITDTESKKKIYDSEIKEGEKEIKAEYDDLKEFVLDPNGYFLIRANHEKNQIELGFCRKGNEVEVKITGTTPLDIYQTIIKHNLITRKDHAAYLGRELQKAFIALQQKIKYVQDDELDFTQKVN